MGLDRNFVKCLDTITILHFCHHLRE